MSDRKPERIGALNAEPYRYLAHSKDGVHLRVWCYASLERLMEDAAIDLALGRAAPLRVLDHDETVLYGTEELLDRLREPAIRIASAARRPA